MKEEEFINYMKNRSPTFTCSIPVYYYLDDDDNVIIDQEGIDEEVRDIIDDIDRGEE